MDGMPTCDVCGKSFKPQGGGSKVKRFCSTNCRVVAWRARHPEPPAPPVSWECEWCGKHVTRPAQGGGWRGRFCSTTCRVASWRAEHGMKKTAE